MTTNDNNDKGDNNDDNSDNSTNNDDDEGNRLPMHPSSLQRDVPEFLHS